MPAFSTHARATQFSNPPWLIVETHDVEFPNGHRVRDWPWVITPDYVNVLAETPDGHFLCFRQRKYAFEGESLAIPGGYIEPGEDPLTAAQRELREETGYTAAEWISLGGYAVDANRGCGNGHLFYARGAQPAGEPTEHDLEEPELVMLDRDALRKALFGHAFKVISWSATVGMTLAYDCVPWEPL